MKRANQVARRDRHRKLERRWGIVILVSFFAVLVLAPYVYAAYAAAVFLVALVEMTIHAHRANRLDGAIEECDALSSPPQEGHYGERRLLASLQREIEERQ